MAMPNPKSSRILSVRCDSSAKHSKAMHFLHLAKYCSRKLLYPASENFGARALQISQVMVSRRFSVSVIRIAWYSLMLTLHSPYSASCRILQSEVRQVRPIACDPPRFQSRILMATKIPISSLVILMVI